MRKLLVLTFAALALTACESATPYQPAGPPNIQSRDGYSDQQIESNRWRVTFSGNSLTSRETVERYLLFRAGQLTLNQGFEWFEAVERHTERSSSYLGDTGFGGYGYGYGGWGGYWGPSWGLYGRGFGWGFGGPDPFFNGPVDVEQVSRYQASAEIIMGRGPKPVGDVRAFNARSVVDHLQSSIKYPKS